VAELVAEAGWKSPRLVRLRDVDWATTLELRLPERLLGVTPRFAVVGD
jgi:2-polyprenyl-6-methoxyphenol hydroxylase-like FAD-dependent oxidoreductase